MEAQPIAPLVQQQPQAQALVAVPQQQVQQVTATVASAALVRPTLTALPPPRPPRSPPPPSRQVPAPANPYEAPYEPPLSAEEALAAAAREGLTLPRAVSQTGYRGVSHVTGKKARPYQAWVCRDGKVERLGRFATPEEAALCRARTPEGKKAASAAGVGPVPMTVEEAERQAEAAEARAEAEGLTLQRSENQTGFVGVYVNTSNKVKPFEARVGRDGKRVYLGHFATAEEAALEVARAAADEPEGKKRKSAPTKKRKLLEEPPVVQAPTPQLYSSAIPSSTLEAQPQLHPLAPATPHGLSSSVLASAPPWTLAAPLGRRCAL